jgi:sirohydrochlorin ferrochelatase
MTAFVVFAHGSRIESANEAVRALAAQMAERASSIVEPAFLELGQPDLSGAVGRLTARGAARVIVIPYFLTLGTHMQRDLPALAAQSAQTHGIEVEVAPPLDGHPALLDALLDRAREALSSGRQLV